ncbi:S8 family serine peptidase [Aliikangiella marina]|uniref:S8 family serine peptidase n=1 Tax=Aliikangiella marina TaxID=1712262 RepID=A0A545TDY2_9GAMM|nr:S8 family serine peptidase [Aliikangiella marina]TQV75433.1 S8 family serine peptidase [Aliikangiella marina]
MKIKSIVTALLAAGTFGASAVTVSEYKLEPVLLGKNVVESASFKANGLGINVAKPKLKTLSEKALQQEFLDNNAHDGEKLYIVRLMDDSIPTYKGDVKGFPATNKSNSKSINTQIKFDAKSSEAKKYGNYLNQKQNEFIQKASSKLGQAIPDLRRYKYAINGFLTKLTHSQAKQLAMMPEVEFIEPSKMFEINSDRGPEFIGAGAVWDGSASGTEYQGEGTIVAIFDTGVNTDNPSFAATGDDGYTVTNPWGDDVYVGDCVAQPTLCNSKLIGVRSYDALLDFIENAGFTRPANGEDYNGHGSHTAGTSAGNVLFDVPLVIADPAGGEVSDGIETSTTFPRMSGVAPHANIISYQTCLPGNTGDTLRGCFSPAILGAIDDAIADGVDVINYSVGGTTPFNPWLDSTEVGFLSANAAGVYVATSAGNSGPNPLTTTKAAPWYSSTAATTHDRVVSTALDFNGTDYDFQVGSGPGLPDGGLTAPVIESGAVDAANVEGCSAFPANSFDASIALISRGSCAFSDKINNAGAAGAVAVIVYNNAGDGLISMSAPGTSIPGVFVGQTDGEAMVAALTATPGLSATIDSQNFVIGTGTGDVMASFSSRGPNEFGQIIAPQIAAPGVSVYAAYADEHFYRDVTTPAPREFAFLSGTSMAGPHVAGAAALIMQAHPTWNPDQVRSALMMTSTQAVLKEDGVTPADAFDIGSGRVQVDQAINTGLVMSETQENYLAADPNNGGDVKALNIPSMANYGCGVTCSWTRTFTAVRDGSYAFTTDNPDLTVTPANVDATAGNDFSVTITMDASDLDDFDEVFANVVINATDQPELHLPVFVRINRGAVPDDFTITAGRNDGSFEVEGLESFSTSNLTFTIDGLYDANATGFSATETFSIAEDPTNASYDDDLDQVFVYEFSVPVNSVALNLEITETTSPDLDLFLQLDSNGDGNYDALVGASATVATLESISLQAPTAGNYRAIVQNWAGSGAAEDTGTLSVSVVPQTDPVAGLSIDAPTSASGLEPVAATLLWDLEMAPGDAYFADITMSGDGLEIGTFRVNLNRAADDFAAATSVQLASRGDSIDYTLTVNPSTYNVDQNLEITVDMPANMSLVPGSVVASGGSVIVKDPNASGLNIVDTFDIAEDPSNGDYRDDLSQVYVNEFVVPSGSLSLTAAISGSTSPDNDLFIEFDSAGDGSYATLVAFAATAEANEVASVDAPAEGNYRVIVQNWAGSGAASDTGTITITTVAATGEGFQWNLGLNAPIPSYSVVSSTESAACAVAGLGGWAGTPGYTPLSAFGITTSGLEGDEIAINAFTSRSFPFFGEDNVGITVSENGFLTFDGDIGANAWFNRPIPNTAAPNDIFAGLWIDQILVDDGTRGLRTANLGPMAILDFDGLQPWTPDGVSSDRFKYQFQVFDSIQEPGDAFGQYELIISYASDQIGSIAGATAGVENQDGSYGVDASAMIAAGTQLCFDAEEFAQGYEVTFSVIPEAAYSGQSAAPEVSVESDMEGTSTLTVAATQVELTNVAPIANAGEDVTYDRADVDEITLDAVNTVDYDTDRLAYRWQQISGETVTIRGGNSLKAYLDVADMANGTYTFQLSVDDGEFNSSDTVTITVTGEEQESSGIGSMGILLLLGIPLLFRRRYTH